MSPGVAVRGAPVFRSRTVSSRSTRATSVATAAAHVTGSSATAMPSTGPRNASLDGLIGKQSVSRYVNS